jgi:hypothetical protein
MNRSGMKVTGKSVTSPIAHVVHSGSSGGSSSTQWLSIRTNLKLAPPEARATRGRA